jgi:hypothetical protein
LHFGDIYQTVSIHTFHLELPLFAHTPRIHTRSTDKYHQCTDSHYYISSEMPVSPYRYYQLARYFVQRWLDHAPPLAASWKGKGRAAPVLQGAAAFGGGGILRAGLEERRTWNDMVPALAGGAGSASLTSASTSRDARSDSKSNTNSSNKVHIPSKRTPYTPRALRPDPNLPGPNQQEIYRLMNDSRLGDPGVAKAPREVVVLCHGTCMSQSILRFLRTVGHSRLLRWV